MPPSAMIGTPRRRARRVVVQIAESCGIPAPLIDPGRADRSGADADLDGVGSGVGEGVDTLGRDDVAGDDRKVGPAALDPLDRLDHAGRVAVGGVDRHDVDAAADEGVDPRLELVADADGGGAAQATGVVAAGVGELLALLDVLDRDQAGEATAGVDERAASRCGAAGGSPWRRRATCRRERSRGRSDVMNSEIGRS